MGSISFCYGEVASQKERFNSIYNNNRSSHTPEESIILMIDDAPTFIQSKSNWPIFVDYIAQKGTDLPNQNSISYANLAYRIALLMYNHRHLYKSYEYLDRVSMVLENKDLSKVKFAAKYYRLRGDVYYNFNRYSSAKKCLFQALNLETLSIRSKINAYNSLGLVYRGINKSDSSIYFFNKGLTLAEKSKNEDWKGIIIGNLGYSHYLHGDTVKAKKFLNMDKTISLSHGEWASAQNALTSIIEIELKQNDFGQLDENMKLLDSLNNINTAYSSKRDYFHVKMLYSEHEKNYKKALHYYGLSVKYADSSRIVHSQSDFKNLEFQIAFEKKQAKTKLLIEKQKRSRLFYLGIFLIMLIGVFACIIIIYQLRRRRKKEREILELRNERIQIDLQRNKRELGNLIKNISQKNEIIDTLHNEITNKEAKVDSLAIQQEKQELHEKIQSITLLTEQDLVEFKLLFNKIYPGFYDILVSKHLDLTKAEIRLIMLFRLNLSTFEMAQILGISEDSVRRTNHRVRKKLDIENQNELISYIFSINEADLKMIG